MAKSGAVAPFHETAQIKNGATDQEIQSAYAALYKNRPLLERSTGFMAAVLAQDPAAGFGTGQANHAFSVLETVTGDDVRAALAKKSSTDSDLQRMRILATSRMSYSATRTIGARPWNSGIPTRRTRTKK